MEISLRNRVGRDEEGIARGADFSRQAVLDEKLRHHCDGFFTLREHVFATARIARYAASGRRLEFNDDDLYRHYPELDAKR